jgi:hypothetical protein
VTPSLPAPANATQLASWRARLARQFELDGHLRDDDLNVGALISALDQANAQAAVMAYALAHNWTARQLDWATAELRKQGITPSPATLSILARHPA